MTYSKLPKICQDYPLGFQDVNQAIDNNAAIRDLYDVRHGVLTSAPGAGSSRNPWTLAGRHDDVHVQRTVALVTVSTSYGIASGSLTVSGGAITAIARAGTGQWTLAISGLATWWAIGQPHDTAASSRKVTCYRIQPTSGQHLLDVTTYALDAGSFAATDYDFSLAIWGTTA